MTTLRQAAQAAIERWDAPMGSDLPDIGNCMDDLRAALDAPGQEQEPMAWISITQHDSTTTIDNTFDDRVVNWPLGEYKLYAMPVDTPENQVLQATCDAFLANVQLLEVEIEAMAKERDALLLAKQATECSSDEWLANCPQSVRDLANKIKQAQVVEPVAVVQKSAIFDGNTIVQYEGIEHLLVVGAELYLSPQNQLRQPLSTERAELIAELRTAHAGHSDEGPSSFSDAADMLEDDAQWQSLYEQREEEAHKLSEQIIKIRAQQVAVPAREPLSDGLIDAVTLDQWGEMKGYPLAAHRTYARAIEAKAQQVEVPAGYVPMTPVEINRAVRKVESIWTLIREADMTAFARAIEAHHGITPQGDKP